MPQYETKSFEMNLEGVKKFLAEKEKRKQKKKKKEMKEEKKREMKRESTCKRIHKV